MEREVVPIHTLDPDSAPPANVAIRAIVTLAWPYSSSTKQCALLLADKDFRLRSRKGQVRVRFTGASAEAVAKSRIGIGDEVVVELNGAAWAQDGGQARTPGKSVDGELVYGRRLDLKISNAEGELDINVDAPTPPLQSREEPEIDLPAATPMHKVVGQVRSLDLDEDGAPIYTSPAFAKRLRLSRESFLETAYDPFLDEGSLMPLNKQWRYADRSPSPQKLDFEPGYEADIVVATKQQSGTPTETQDEDMVDAEEPVELSGARDGLDDDVDEPSKATEMPPPPLPRLEMPTSKTGAETQVDGPLTPKLQAVPNSALPLPSPFPGDATQRPFDEGTDTAHIQSAGIERKSLNDKQAEMQSMASPQAFEASPKAASQASKTGEDLVAAPATQPAEDDDVLQANNNARGANVSEPPGVPASDRRDRVAQSPKENHSPISVQTPIRRSVNGVSPGGVPTANSALQATPQSEKDKVMAQTFQSLFGFKTTPEVQPSPSSNSHEGMRNQSTNEELTRQPYKPTTQSTSGYASSFGFRPSPKVPPQLPHALDQSPAVTSQVPPAEDKALETSSAVQREDADAAKVIPSRLRTKTAPYEETVENSRGSGTGPVADNKGLLNMDDRVDNQSIQEPSPHSEVSEAQAVNEAQITLAEEIIHEAVVNHEVGASLAQSPMGTAAPSTMQDSRSELLHDFSSPVADQYQAASPEAVTHERDDNSMASHGLEDPIQIDERSPSADTMDPLPSDPLEPLRIDQTHPDLGRSSPIWPVNAVDTTMPETLAHHSVLQSDMAQSDDHGLTSPLFTSQFDGAADDVMQSPDTRSDNDAAMGAVQLFPERVIEDSQSDFHTSNLSTQPTPVPEEGADVIQVPDRETKSYHSFTADTFDDATMTGQVDLAEEGFTPVATPTMSSGDVKIAPASTARTTVIELSSTPPAEAADAEPSASSGTPQDQNNALSAADEAKAEDYQPQLPTAPHVGHATVIELLSSSPLASEQPYFAVHETPLVDSGEMLEEDSSEPSMVEHAGLRGLNSTEQMPTAGPTGEVIQRLDHFNEADSTTNELFSLSDVELATNIAADRKPLASSTNQLNEEQVEDSAEPELSGTERRNEAETSLAHEVNGTSLTPASALVESPTENQHPFAADTEPITYPTLPPSPLQSQPTLEQEDRSHREQSMLPPTPQLTQEVSDRRETREETTTQDYLPSNLDGIEERDVMSPPPTDQHVQAPPVLQPRTPARRSLTARLSHVPDVISAWFSPKRTPQQKGNTGDEHDEPTTAVREAGTKVSNGRTETDGSALTSRKSPTLKKALTNGLSTSLGYFTPLARLQEHLNPSSQQAYGSSTVDVIAVVSDKASSPDRAKGGPRDYFTIMHVVDNSLAANVRVEVFRPWKATLPFAEVGDVVLLRAFVVKSRKRQPYLLSTDASAWCVWRFSDVKQVDDNEGKPVWARKRSDSVVREEIKGPPVELGAEERDHARSLRDWWVAEYANGSEGNRRMIGNGKDVAYRPASPQLS